MHRLMKLILENLQTIICRNPSFSLAARQRGGLQNFEAIFAGPGSSEADGVCLEYRHKAPTTHSEYFMCQPFRNRCTDGSLLANDEMKSKQNF